MHFELRIVGMDDREGGILAEVIAGVMVRAERIL
jgi:hypothetical protein